MTKKYLLRRDKQMTKEYFSWFIHLLGWTQEGNVITKDGLQFNVYWVLGNPYFYSQTDQWGYFNEFAGMFLDDYFYDESGKVSFHLKEGTELFIRGEALFLPWKAQEGIALAISALDHTEDIPVLTDWLIDNGYLA